MLSNQSLTDRIVFVIVSIHVWCLDTTLAFAILQVIQSCSYSFLVQAIARDLQ